MTPAPSRSARLARLEALMELANASPSGSQGMLVVQTFADLASTAPDPSDAVWLQGYSGPETGGGGEFFWDPDLLTLADAATISYGLGTGPLIPGRWVRAESLGTLIQVEWFGGLTNAAFLNNADGKWYQDAGFTVPASDDAIKFQDAVNYCATRASTENDQFTIHARGGIWYFSAKHGSPAGPTSGNEFVLWFSNIDLEGDGDSTEIFIAGGTNTMAFQGYSCVFGHFSNVSVNNVTFRNFQVNHNSPHNQWFANTGTITLSWVLNSLVNIVQGDNVNVDDCLSFLHNGVFAIATGQYGTPNLLTNCRVSRNRVLDCSLDPNLGDSSMVSAGFTNALMFGNRVITVTSNNTTAYEIHPVGCDFYGNYCFSFNGGLNLAGDSADLVNVNVTGNVFRQVTAGISTFSFDGFKNENLHISDNVIDCFFWALRTVDGPSAGHAAGAGYINCSVTDNILNCITGLVPTQPAIIWTDDSNGVEIAGNQIEGFDNGLGTTAGIQVGTRSSTGGLLTDVNIHDNRIKNCGANGILVTGIAGDVSAQFSGLWIHRNKITDTHLVHVLSSAVKVTAFTDASCTIYDNKVNGNLGTDLFFDNTNYPAQTANTSITGGGDFFFDLSNSTTGENTGNGQFHYRYRTGTGLFLVDNGLGTLAFAVSDTSIILGPPIVDWAQFTVNPTLSQLDQAGAQAANPMRIRTQRASGVGGFNLGGDLIFEIPQSIAGPTQGTMRWQLNNMVDQITLTLGVYTLTTQITSFIIAALGGGGTLGLAVNNAGKVVTSTGVPVVTGTLWGELTWNGTTWVADGLVGATGTDANITVNCGASVAADLDANKVVVPAGTLSGNRTYTLGTDSAVTNESITIERKDVSANTLAIVNGGAGGGTLYTFPASKKRVATFTFDGTNWFMVATAALA